MDFQTAVRTCLNKYATFEGRARRSELWWFALFTFLGNMILGIFDNALFGGAGVLSGVFSLAVLLPSLAVGARRLHDTGRSGWWLLLLLVPVIGLLVLIWFYIQPGDNGPNAYGPDPIAKQAF